MSEKSTMKASRSLYSIQNAPFSYCTGHLSNGYQVLTASDDKTGATTFPRVEFDGDGNLLATYDKETEYTSSDTLTFTPGTISVKPFFIPELWFGIEDLPEHYQEFLDHPENAGEYERLFFAESIDGWRESGEFVLWFHGRDFFLSEEGDLESS